MSHGVYIAEVPAGFRITAHTDSCPVAGMECPEKNFYAVQFHPEVVHTKEGTRMLSNFVYNVCGCSGDWKMDSFVDTTIKALREKIGNGKVLCALSGGVDSSVAAVMLSKAIGKQLTCVFVDHGLLRKNEGDEVEAVFGPEGAYDLNFIRVNAQERFYARLKGVEEPEAKRKIIGEEFIRVFEEEAKKIGAVDYLVQGTIYPDVIESGLGKSAVIKSHHNVGGLPEHVDFKELVEPLRLLFKDEVRKAGYRVVYQPLSKVIHFEGVSNGTDVNGTGLKRYQVENSEKLKEKWAEEFKKQCVNTGNPNPFRARERSQGKKIILVVDHYVPTFDRDAGSKTTYQYLKMFLKKGYVVKFLGDNFLHEEPYTTTLLQMGIEVLYGDTYAAGIWDWLKTNGDEISFAYLNRPHIATKYVDFIKDYTNMKVIYYGHDLHFLRLGRDMS